MKPTDEQLDYPDCGNPDRKTGVETPPEIRKLIEERQAARGHSAKQRPQAAE